MSKVDSAALYKRQLNNLLACYAFGECTAAELYRLEEQLYNSFGQA